MRTIFILLLLFLVSFCFAQRPIPHIDVSDSNYVLVACVLQPSFDTATHQNKWNIIESNGHSKIHFKDSVVVTITNVQLFFDTTYSKVITWLIVNDESTNRMIQTTANFEGQAGAQYYNNGSFVAGASVSQSSATITFTNQRSLGFDIYYDGAAWQIIDAPYNAINMAVSQKPTISYSAGRLRIQNLPFNMRSYPVVTSLNINEVDSLYGFIPTAEFINPTWVDIYFWDSKSNQKFTGSSPTAFMGCTVNFGDVFQAANPLIEDMGFGSNWWIIGVLKK